MTETQVDLSEARADYGEAKSKILVKILDMNGLS